MSKIIVNYVTKQSHCSCCEQRLLQIKTSKVKQFTIRPEDVTDWADREAWQSSSECADEMEQMVNEFVNEIISFHAEDMFSEIVIENIELVNLKEFIVREVLHQAVGHQSTE